jgi:hypothetical protein
MEAVASNNIVTQQQPSRSLLGKLWWSVYWRHVLLGAGIAVGLRVAANGLYPHEWEKVVEYALAWIASFPASYLALKWSLSKQWALIVEEAREARKE